MVVTCNDVPEDYKQKYFDTVDAITKRLDMPAFVDTQTDVEKGLTLYSVFQPHLILTATKESYIFQTYIGAENDTSIKPVNVCLRVTQPGLSSAYLIYPASISKYTNEFSIIVNNKLVQIPMIILK